MDTRSRKVWKESQHPSIQPTTHLRASQCCWIPVVLGWRWLKTRTHYFSPHCVSCFGVFVSQPHVTNKRLHLSPPSRLLPSTGHLVSASCAASPCFSSFAVFASRSGQIATARSAKHVAMMQPNKRLSNWNLQTRQGVERCLLSC